MYNSVKKHVSVNFDSLCGSAVEPLFMQKAEGNFTIPIHREL